MNTPSPLVPQGTVPEPRRRSYLKVGLLIFFLHVGVLAGFLLQGCKPETESPKTTTDAGGFPATFGSDASLTNSPFSATVTQDSNLIVSAAPPPPGVPNGASPSPYGAGAPLPSAVSALPPAPAQPIYPAPVVDPVVTSTPSQDHTVMRGETLAIIAKKYGMGWKSIAAANPGVDPTRLKIGQKLTIPAKSVSSAAVRSDTGLNGFSAEGTSEGGTYVVKSGDTLAKIAKAHGTSVKSLKAMNGLKLDRITVGQKIKLPARIAPAAPEALAPAPSYISPPPTPLPPAPTGAVPYFPTSLPPPTRVP